MTYYLQRTDGIWETVDEYVFKNWKYAQEGDEPRYNGNSITQESGKYTLNIANATTADLAIVMRFLGVKECTSITQPGGFVREPEFVKLALPRQKVLHEVGGGNFKQVA